MPDGKPRVASRNCRPATSHPRAFSDSGRLPSRGRPRRPSARRVCGPATPSAGRPRRRWRRWTAARVAGPGDAVDGARVEAAGAQRDLQGGDVRGGGRRRGGRGEGEEGRDDEQAEPHPSLRPIARADGKDGRDVAGPRGTRSRVRGRLIAGLGLLVVLLVGGAGAGEDGSARALRAGHVGVDGRDDRRADAGCPPTSWASDGVRSTPTSPTNIGAYLWSAVAAERLGIIGHREAVARLARTIGTLETMERGNAGQYFNWYDIRDGSTSRRPRRGGDAATPILSSVDNGWLATGLRMVASRVPELRARAQALFDSMDFGFYYRPDVNRILFHYVPVDRRGGVLLRHDRLREPDRDLRRDREGPRSRRASTTGRTARSPTPATGPGPRRSRSGRRGSYLGETVFEGALPYAGTRVTPSWGGSMFEALMPTLFVPEERWAPGSWGVNHPLWVRAQIHHGLAEARYGYWGFSPSNTPEGGYGVYGVDAIGIGPDGYPSNEDATLVDHGFPGCPERDRRSPTRRRRPTRTASSPRTPRSSRSATRRATRSPTCAGSSATSRGCTASGASATASTSTPAACRTTTSRSTRAWRWPRSATRWAATCSAARSRRSGPSGAAAGDRRRGVRRDAARLHDHRHARPRPAARHARAPTSSAASAATTGSTAAGATTRSSATPGATGWRAATEPTPSMATTATTSCRAAEATTWCRAGPDAGPAGAARPQEQGG